MERKQAQLGVALLLAAGMAHAQESGAPPDQVAAPSSPQDETAAGNSGLDTIPVDSAAPGAEDDTGHVAPRGALIQEVVVTAQKREENLQDVPISITALNGEQMRALGVTNPQDLTMVVPGLQQTEAVGFSVTYLRGVGTDAFLQADPSVAIYIDDVYLPFTMAANQKFGKLERTEVLKGPQGTLFGRNAVGGAMNIITKKPEFSGFDSSLETEVGNYNQKSIKYYANVPLLDNFAVNMTLLYDDRDSYYDAVKLVSSSNPNGTKVGGERAKGIQFKLRYDPFDWMDTGFSYSRVIQHGVSGLYCPNDEPSPLGTALGIKAQKGFDGAQTNEDAFLLVTNDVVSGYIKSEFSWFDVKLLGSYQDITTGNSIDFDGSPLPLVGFQVVNNGASIATSEFQILSNADSWNAEHWSWILGAYYFHSRQGSKPITAEVGSTSLAQGRLLGIQVPQSIVDLLLASPTAALFELPSGSITFNGLIATDSYSGFFQTTYHFTDWLGLTLGGRYQDELRSIIDSSASLEGIGGTSGQPPVEYINSNDKSQFPDLTTKRFSPKVSLELRPFGDALFYATWQKATKGSTYNVQNIVSQAQKVKPEDITAYEVGFKADWLDGLVRTSAAAFYYDLKNQQVQFVSLLAGGAIVFENAPKARVIGSDFDVTAQLVPGMIDDLYLTLAGCFLDSKFTDYPMGSGFDPVTGIYTNTGNYTGNKIARSPKFSGRTGLNKIFRMDNSSVEVAGDLYYNSGYFTSASNNAPSKQDAYKVANLRATYGYDPLKVHVTAYVRNVGDEEYSISKLNNDFGTLTTLAAPRTFGLQVDWQY